MQEFSQSLHEFKREILKVFTPSVLRYGVLIIISAWLGYIAGTVWGFR